MNLLVKNLSALALSLSTVTVFAAIPNPPTHLVTHNTTSEESNAYMAAGTIPSIYPTPPKSIKKVYWKAVRLICHDHKEGTKCPAVIKMASNTANPIEIGLVILDLETGDISPKQLSNNGYTLTVNGPGEATITKD